jgi:DNA-binding MarR family transcriptional regulator/hypoxanthine-guanine phosphoribosyltransferase
MYYGKCLKKGKINHFTTKTIHSIIRTMENTVFNTNQHKKIITTLTNEGSFAISDIEKGNSVSREQIGKVLKNLTNNESLVKNTKAGANVKYKLTTNKAGITFLLTNTDQATIEDIASAWDVSVASAKKYIKKFVDEGIIEKIGKPPKKINYTIAQQGSTHQYSTEQERTIERYFTYITPDGRLFNGTKGFEKFITSKYGKQESEGVEKIARKYMEIRDEYYGIEEQIKTIDTTNKIKQAFQDSYAIEKMFYADFDELPIFEKTQLYQLITIAKNGQRNTGLMMEIINSIQNNINKLINEYEIDAVGFIPPTIMRKTQLMTFIKNRLDISIDQIEISKATNLLPVQQKSLTKIKDRKLNAKNSIVVKSKKQYESVLLIDDVVGSGATLNETAKKILQQNIAQKVYTFAAVGSAKPGEFEIIPG